MYNKRIICDIDDTICITKDRDFSNAIPVISVINKINFLYDLGWEIWLLTARGQLSCNENFELADKKYRSQIENWLLNNGVKYHKLSFEKYLATYYIDDKGLTPEEFINLDIKELKNGWSGASVELRNNKVFKTHKDSLSVSKWYKIAKHFFNVPKVYSLIGNTLCMEFINNNDDFNLDEIITIIDKFSNIKVDSFSFDSYIKRIENHCDFNLKFYEVLPLLKLIEYDCNNLKSFCHGDFSIDNILVNDKKHFLIDPIYDENCYSSFLLDISKLMCSFRKNMMSIEYDYLKSKFKHLESILDILEITQWIRIYKYAPEIEKENIEKIIYKLLYEFKKN